MQAAERAYTAEHPRAMLIYAWAERLELHDLVETSREGGRIRRSRVQCTGQHVRAQRRQAQDVGSRHAAVQDIPADRHLQPVEVAAGRKLQRMADGQRIEQGLWLVAMRRVAAIR